MSATFQQLRIVNFGRSKKDATGPTGVGYQLLDYAGSIALPRTTDGVYQTAPGIYAAYIAFPDEFRGQILWDTGSAFAETFYASEQHNTEENLPDTIYDKLNLISDKVDTIDGSIASTITSGLTSIQNRVEDIYHLTAGRWVIKDNQMIFYKDDNVTELMRFNLFDNNGSPSMDAVFDRTKVL